VSSQTVTFFNWKFCCMSVGNVHPLVKFLGQSAWSFSLTKFGIRHELGLMLDCRLHDRKMFVLGLCTLLSMTGDRPQVLTDEAHRILPSIILVFKGLKRAYECKILLILQPWVVASVGWRDAVQSSARWSARSRSQHNIRTIDENSFFLPMSTFSALVVFHRMCYKNARYLLTYRVPLVMESHVI